MDIGTPERYLQASWDILEGRVRDRRRRAPRRRRAAGRGRGAGRSGASVDPGAARGRGRGGAGAAIGARAVIGRGSEIGERATVSSSVLLSDCRIGAEAEVHEAILAPGVEVGEGARIEAGAVIGEGARIEAGAAIGDGRAPGPGRGRVVSDDALAAIRAADRSNQLDDVLALPDHLRDALWRVESARLEPFDAPAAWSSAGWAARRSAATSPPPRSATALSRPLTTVRGYELPSVDAARPRRALLELLGRHRGDARLLRGRRGARRPADRRHHRRRSSPTRPRARRRAGDRAAGGPAAARRGRLHVHGRRRGRRAGRRGAGHPHRDRQLGRPPARRPATRSPSAPPSSPSSSRARSRSIYGADLTAPVAVPLEDPDQRERQAARVRRRAARGRPQRDRRLGAAPARRRRFSAVFLEDRDQHPRVAPALRADREADRARRRGRRPGRDRGRDPHRAPAVGGDARRPGLAPARRPPGRRPRPDRGDRPAQGRARPPGIAGDERSVDPVIGGKTAPSTGRVAGRAERLLVDRGGRRARLRSALRRLVSSRRSLAAPVGRVGRRFRGTARPAASFSRRRSSASSRFRAWLRASWATAVTRVAVAARPAARFCSSVSGAEAAIVEHRLDPRGGHVGVLASRPRGAAGAELDLGQRHGHLGVDWHRIVHRGPP